MVNLHQLTNSGVDSTDCFKVFVDLYSVNLVSKDRTKTVI